MPQSPPAYVTPSALRSARESLGFSLEEAAARINVNPAKLEEAESGEAHLTLRQAETAARLYERPLAELFLPEPRPEEPPEAQFRRLPGAPAPPWPREMRALARRVRSRQEAAVELYALLDEDPPWGALDLPFTDDPEFLGVSARELLGVALSDQKSWRDPSGYEPLRAWIDAIEDLGVLVMQDGTLPVEEMRGFASTHGAVPAIVVNTSDDPRARAFTAVHEFGHLLRAQAGHSPVPTTEQWCNDFASGVLMPRDPFARDFERAVLGRTLLRAIESVALDYGVTPHAAAVRVARLRLAPQDDVDTVIDEIQERGRGREREASGGNYYLTMVGRLGPSFIRLVFSALDTQGVTYTAASGLLGVKVNNFEKLRERAEERIR